MPDPKDPPNHNEPTTPGIVSRTDFEKAEADLPSAPPQKKYREITLASIIFGVIVGTIMNAAITYSGLKIGFTIVGSSIAAVLGFGFLRGVLRKGSILEVNIAQTIGSAVNTPNSGVIFTVPVLFLLGIPLLSESGGPNMNFWLLTLACVTGAILGGAFIVPLRKQMLDIERLRFPSAVAVGTILKSPGAGATKSIVLVVGIIVSALIALPANLPALSSPAELDELEQLLFDEKPQKGAPMSIDHILRTRMIASWIEDENAPASVLDHGKLLAELATTRTERNDLEADADDTALIAQMASLETQIEDAFAAATADLAATYNQGPYAVRDYPKALAEYAFTASQSGNASDWKKLKSTKAGWAEKPMFGYSDLGLRLSKEIDTNAAKVDYAFNGTGELDDVLTRNVDRDRRGRPDLVVTDTGLDVGRILGLPGHMQLIFAIAPFALGAGYLTGRAGLYVLAGGVLAYLVINPVMSTMGWLPETILSDQVPKFGHDNINRPLGIGLLLGGAMMGVVAALPAIKEAFKSIAVSSSTKAGSDELGLKVLLVAVAAATIFLFVASTFVGGQPINPTDPVDQISEVETTTHTLRVNGYTIGFASAESLDTYTNTWTDAQRDDYMHSINASQPGLLHKLGLGKYMTALVIALIGAAWIWFAGIIIAQCTGMTDWSPISGMALITVVLVMVLAGVADRLGAIMIGAALCVAITCAADMMSDLKTGYIVGASPKKQQIVELIATGIGPLISMLVLLLIAAANMEKFGIQMGPGTDTTAPQAQALQAVVTGVQGGSMPYVLYAAGGIMGALLGLGSFAGLGVLVGLSMYLPMQYIATYGIGCIINIFVTKAKGRTWAEEWGVPLAAGFIVGDSLLGLGVNMFVLVQS